LDIQEIEKAAKRAAGLTRQLLIFSRQQVLEPRALDLNALVGNLEKMLHRLIGADIELRTKPAAALGAVRADPGQLEQAIVNLVVNARDAMPQGGRLTIETADVELDRSYVAGHVPTQPGPYVLLAVSDTGVGMDGATKARLFEPFFTTKEAGRGTGLGLSTVYGIVKQSGGYVWAYSEPEAGATFNICLPRIDRDADEAPIVPHPPEHIVGGKETVLLVEDDSSVRELVTKILGQYGYRVIAAASGTEAIRLGRQFGSEIHLLLTDVIMPDGSGKDLTAILQGLVPRLRVLYMSGYPHLPSAGVDTME